MKILSYIIPENLQTNSFIISLAHQVEKKGKLSKRQEEALRDIIGIEEDFFLWDVECPMVDDEQIMHDFLSLKKKFNRNGFRKTKTKNACVRALNSILESEPNYSYIDTALGRNFNNYRRRY